jgi:hypothetical protein
MSATSDGSRVVWLLPAGTMLGALVLFSFGPADLSIVLYLLAAAIVGLILLTAALLKRSLQPLFALTVFLVFSAVIVKKYSVVRDDCRWTVWSHTYKPKVLAQPDSATGELKHVEWDGWGFAGAGDTTVYLVFDPKDALSAAARSHQPGKFVGLPCEVPLVHELESHWYAVRFYTDESWGTHGALDCGQ